MNYPNYHKLLRLRDSPKAASMQPTGRSVFQLSISPKTHFTNQKKNSKHPAKTEKAQNNPRTLHHSKQSTAILQIKQHGQNQRKPDPVLQSTHRNMQPTPKIPQNPQVIQNHRQKEIQLTKPIKLRRRLCQKQTNHPITRLYPPPLPKRLTNPLGQKSGVCGKYQKLVLLLQRHKPKNRLLTDLPLMRRSHVYILSSPTFNDAPCQGICIMYLIPAESRCLISAVE